MSRVDRYRAEQERRREAFEKGLSQKQKDWYDMELDCSRGTLRVRTEFVERLKMFLSNIELSDVKRWASTKIERTLKSFMETMGIEDARFMSLHKLFDIFENLEGGAASCAERYFQRKWLSGWSQEELWMLMDREDEYQAQHAPGTQMMAQAALGAVDWAGSWFSGGGTRMLF